MLLHHCDDLISWVIYVFKIICYNVSNTLILFMSRNNYKVFVQNKYFSLSLQVLMSKTFMYVLSKGMWERQPSPSNLTSADRRKGIQSVQFFQTTGSADGLWPLPGPFRVTHTSGSDAWPTTHDHFRSIDSGGEARNGWSRQCHVRVDCEM